MTHRITYTGTYYFLAHFSKVVRPGAVRVQTSERFSGSAGNGVSNCGEGTRGGTVEQRDAGGEGEPGFRWENVAACATRAVDHHSFMVSSQMLGGSDTRD
jgi:hypothetical protein